MICSRCSGVGRLPPSLADPDGEWTVCSACYGRKTITVPDVLLGIPDETLAERYEAREDPGDSPDR